MRITGSRMLELAAQATSRTQAEVGETAAQLSSGKRVERPSDDPLAWAQARRAEVRKTISEGRGDGLALGHDHLAETERALTTLGDLFAASQALAVQAANDSYGATERAELADQVSGMFKAALAAANTKTVAGEYVLAGSASTTAPFDATGTYVGDAAQRALELGEGAQNPATLSGSSLTAAGGVDVLPALARFAAALAANDTAAIQTAVGELATAHGQLTQARGHVGSMMAVVDDANAARGELETTMAAQVANLEEVDVIKAASALAQRSNALSAAQAVNAKLAQLLSPAR